MEGFEVGERYDTMGLRGNDLRRLYFRDVRVPPENVLGEPGEGFRIAMHVLNNGRLSLGTGSVGAAKWLLDAAIEHVKERRQFDRPLADFELVQDKIGWMVSYLFGLESLAYLTTGLVDTGVPDYSLESAICKVAGTEFLWYQRNRALQLKGGAGYMRDEPYEKMLRDTRIFPIFEGANDVLRAFIALTGMKPLGDELSSSATSASAIRSARSACSPITWAAESSVRCGRSGSRGLTGSSRRWRIRSRSRSAAALGDRSLLHTHGRAIVERQFHQKRLASAVSDIYAQVAVLSRVTDHLGEHGVEPSGQELYICETFCRRAASG